MWRIFKSLKIQTQIEINYVLVSVDEDVERAARVQKRQKSNAGCDLANDVPNLLLDGLFVLFRTFTVFFGAVVSTFLGRLIVGVIVLVDGL